MFDLFHRDYWMELDGPTIQNIETCSMTKAAIEQKKCDEIPAFCPVPTRSASFQTMLKSFQRILTGTNSGDKHRTKQLCRIGPKNDALVMSHDWVSLCVQRVVQIDPFFP